MSHKQFHEIGTIQQYGTIDVMVLLSDMFANETTANKATSLGIDACHAMLDATMSSLNALGLEIVYIVQLSTRCVTITLTEGDAAKIRCAWNNH